MVSSQNSHIDVVKVLLENEALVDLQNYDGWPSLIVSSQNGHVDVVKMLLENIAQVNLQGMVFFDGGKLNWPYRCS